MGWIKIVTLRLVKVFYHLQGVPAYSEIFLCDVTITPLHQLFRVHRVSNLLFSAYIQTLRSYSAAKAVYTPKGFFLHAASLGQAFAHCPIFLTAASRRSVDSVAVPLRRAVLSNPLSVIALVGRYPANKLIDHRPLREPRAPREEIPNHNFQIPNKFQCVNPKFVIWNLWFGACL